MAPLGAFGSLKRSRLVLRTSFGTWRLLQVELSVLGYPGRLPPPPPPSSIPAVNPLYRNMYDAHHKVTEETFMKRVAQPDFDKVRKPINHLLTLLKQAEDVNVFIKASGGLPQQVINADLHFDNVLVEGAGDNWTVTGILDFEFATYDWRVMEMVCGLSKYTGMENSINRICEYITGYAEAGGKLTLQEAELVPQLIMVRILNNVVYFVGRELAGEDTIEPIVSRALVYSKRCLFLAEHSADIVRHLRAKCCPAS